MTAQLNDAVERHTISGTGPYGFSFRIFAAEELAVVVDAGALDPVPLTLDTHYSVSGVNRSAGGAVTLTATAAASYAGHTIDIRSNTAADQPTSIDRLARQVQDLRRQLRGAMRFPDTSLKDGILSPLSAWAGRYPFINASGVLEPALTIAVTALSRSVVGQALLPQSAAEAAAQQVPADYAQPVGVLERYGLVGDGSMD
ncbi:MAG TPA: hypothetical protein VGQ22_11360, partial [Steroidobacteraceae bacterium]|nr:hypothetical protein [Steroidobacteraceae bacterium]